MRVLHSLTIVVALLFATPATAQIGTDNTGGLSGQDFVSIEPTFPEPGETVTAKLNVYGNELFQSDVVWTLNGEVIGDANNRRSIEYMVGELGETETITASLVRESGSTRRYSLSYEPSYIDIVIEPQTRVPDFYPGRAVPSVGSQINASVLVNNGTLLDPSDLGYVWRLNNQVLNGGPIRGSNQVSFPTPRGSEHILRVEVADSRGVLIGEQAVLLTSVRPELVFYELNPLYGLAQNAITDQLILTGQSVTVMAEPYYLDIATYNEPDMVEWEINNNQSTTNAPSPYQITIQQVGEGDEASVSFRVNSTSELLQGVGGSITVAF